MNKNNHSTNGSNTSWLKSKSGFQVLCVTFLTSIRTILGLFLETSKTETKKLPIIYANIRV